MIIKHRGGGGKFYPLYTQENIKEIATMLKEGIDEQEIRLAIMKAKKVSEPTAYKYVRLAKQMNEKQV